MNNIYLIILWSSNENSNKIEIDENDSIITSGHSAGSYHLNKTNSEGEIEWENNFDLDKKIFNNSYESYPGFNTYDIAFGKDNSIYTIGIVNGDLDGQEISGTDTWSNYDIFVSKYDSGGDKSAEHERCERVQVTHAEPE